MCDLRFGEVHGEAFGCEGRRFTGLESCGHQRFAEGGFCHVSRYINRTTRWSANPLVRLGRGQVDFVEDDSRSSEPPGPTVIASTQNDDLPHALVKCLGDELIVEAGSGTEIGEGSIPAKSTESGNPEHGGDSCPTRIEHLNCEGVVDDSHPVQVGSGQDYKSCGAGG